MLLKSILFNKSKGIKNKTLYSHKHSVFFLDDHSHEQLQDNYISHSLIAKSKITQSVSIFFMFLHKHKTKVRSLYKPAKSFKTFL